MLYELRIYYIYPGKMQDINDRFAKHTLGIFAKHGMRVTDFWIDTDPEHNRLYYVMEFPDMESRNKSFEAFRNDPEWQKVKEETERDNPIVEKVESIYLKQAPFFQK
ncbi:NIPSNAP family protein [Paenibacillus sp. NPDC056579]|uniref:NIPSNAP family protein n=1 Tax=unclassified Paenibacillus TaxID=185978 RepID=UPI001EF86B72|nr:NIPSNAP family protein [Paenibacillus sp. H1-7]ULL16688.1 NIPSNAP family protein [Paenibacillus sp. H1-7]